MPTALHPQTQMTFKFDDAILPRSYGFPVKIRTPTKLGFNNPKHVIGMHVTNKDLGGYWEDRGYNWRTGVECTAQGQRREVAGAGVGADWRANGPRAIDAARKGQGDVAGIKRLRDKASASANAARYFVAADQATFGPGVTNPEKIVCIGLNYRRHAAETGNPVPKEPILFNKFNTALNNHGGTIAVSEEDAVAFDYEAELVIVIGRTARNVS